MLSMFFHMHYQVASLGVADATCFTYMRLGTSVSILMVLLLYFTSETSSTEFTNKLFLMLFYM